MDDEKQDISINTRCGFITIIGRPNVGKSTLMNHLIGQKISITSRKPQTTRHKVNGIVTDDGTQYIFVDTPGFQQLYINKLNTALNQSVINSLANVDSILFVVEAGIFNTGDLAVMELLPKSANVILVVNKKDKLKNKHELDLFIQKVESQYSFKHTIAVSAKHHFGMEELLDLVRKFLPISNYLYEPEQSTDKNSRFLASEIIREKLFRYLGEELPYSVAVEIREFVVEDKLTKIHADVIVDKVNQKGIVIGKGGEKLKKISSDAREDMEKLFNAKIFLQVWVKVKSGFADEAKFLEQFE